MIRYQLYSNEQLLIVKYVGNIGKDELISFFKYCLNKGYLLKIKEIIADYRNAKEVYSTEDLKEITEQRKKVAKGFREIKTNFLVNNPENTVLARLYSDHYKDHSAVRIYSTIEYCANNLSVEISHEELEKILVHPKLVFLQNY